LYWKGSTSVAGKVGTKLDQMVLKTVGGLELKKVDSWNVRMASLKGLPRS